ncbi:MAG: MBOAT family protein [Acidimicrobiia bacterium]|nr:MBOAT family protein [Acidimicrobiia bacterium]
MAFNSVQYAVLLLVVLAVYRLSGRRVQNVVLLVASYVFYGAWDWRFLSLLWVSTLVDYVVGLRLGATNDPLRRRRLLWASMASNLGILGFFKYFNFFAESATALLDGLGLEADPFTLRVVLPVGISFYTFQTMSYTIDIYRREMEPTRDLLSFAVFVAFFPQLVAGPIERARYLLPQFTTDRRPTTGTQFATGAYLIFIGLFKKVVVADALAPFVQDTFANAGTAGWMQLLVGVYAFSLQIYGDFSGYSSIARGSARLLGIDLMVNFNQPYLSRNITEFWRTWHISLSTWLRDYLYIPLGGNRASPVTTRRNLMITMLLGGLWHGAAWTFVVWGGLHGIYLAIHRRFRMDIRHGETAAPGLRDIPAILVTFHLVALSWVFFRADGFSQALDVLTGIVTFRPGPVPYGTLWVLLPVALASLGIDLVQRRTGRHEGLLEWPAPARGLVYGLVALSIVVFSGQPVVPFLYFQF